MYEGDVIHISVNFRGRNTCRQLMAVMTHERFYLFANKRRRGQPLADVNTACFKEKKGFANVL